MEHIHLIVVGDESVDQHLAGVSILGARRVILFDIKNMRRERTEELQGKLREMGIPSQRMETEGEDFREIYWAGRAVFEGCLAEKDICFAINLSAGSRMALAALEDALNIPVEQITHFLITGNPKMPAFRYEIMPGDKKGVRIAPLTFPPVPLIMPGGKRIKYMGLRDIPLTLYTALQMKWFYFRIRARRKWIRFKRKIGLHGKS